MVKPTLQIRCTITEAVNQATLDARIRPESPTRGTEAASGLSLGITLGLTDVRGATEPSTLHHSLLQRCTQVEEIQATSDTTVISKPGRRRRASRPGAHSYLRHRRARHTAVPGRPSSRSPRPLSAAAGPVRRAVSERIHARVRHVPGSVFCLGETHAAHDEKNTAVPSEAGFMYH